jgi:hypothetical protein
MATEKVYCTECEWRGYFIDMLSAPNPFDINDTCQGCPKCKRVNTILYACDYKNCWKPVTCGTPTESGYRSTCSKHRPSLSSRES